MRWRWLVLAGALGAGALLLPVFVPIPVTVSEGYEPYGAPRNHALSKVVKDDRPAFRLAPDKPWRIELGRGSGWLGLATAKLDEDGRVTFHQPRVERGRDGDVLSWETATARLPPDAVAKVLEAVEANRLLELDRAYHAAVYDGTQWVLWVRQGTGRRRCTSTTTSPTRSSDSPRGSMRSCPGPSGRTSGGGPCRRPGTAITSGNFGTVSSGSGRTRAALGRVNCRNY